MVSKRQSVLTPRNIKKILIANRGEIACRVIKTAKKMGISTLAIYSEVDANALHVKLADEAVCVGPAASKDSYLNDNHIINVAIQYHVDAIHPGYGFLSENADFATQCENNGIIFIGPSASAINAMGSKSAAKTIMGKADVPLVPGYHGDNQTPSYLKQKAVEMGFPVLLKAASGGGGKGMREVWNEADFDEALTAAKRESVASFNDDVMLIEKFLTQPRHIEIQVFCDNHGNGVYLFERDCSIQRRHQKVIEEAPAPNFPEETRKQMGEAALRAASAIHYSGAGTVEFLYDTDGSFYFMEMNTRLQVEHPVTELITGEDLVEWQILVARNLLLPKTQSELICHGHAIEARIYAEDPANDFLPSTGTLSLLSPPQQSSCVRVDTGVVQGDEISVYYDPMIAKLIVWGKDREHATKELNVQLQQYLIAGISTNIGYLQNIAKSDAFTNADLSTQFISKNEGVIAVNPPQFNSEVALMAGLTYLLNTHKDMSQSAHKAKNADYSVWNTGDSFRLNKAFTQSLALLSNNGEFELTIIKDKGDAWTINVNHDGKPLDDYHDVKVSGALETKSLQSILTVTINNYTTNVPVWVDKKSIYLFLVDGLHIVQIKEPDLGLSQQDNHQGSVEAPMNGTVVELMVSKGDQVKKGQTIAVIEAMKMEHAIKAPSDAKISACFYEQGDMVDGGSAIVELAPIE